MESLTGKSPDIAEGFVAIGQVVGAWGVHGDVKVAVHTDFPERFTTIQRVYLGPDARAWRVLKGRLHKGQALLRLEGIDQPEAVEPLRNLWVQIPLAEVMPLAEDEHYVFEMVGLRVRTTDGRDLGQVVEVLLTEANAVLVVHGEGDEVLIPYLANVVVAEDLAAGQLTVAPVPGLLD